MTGFEALELIVNDVDKYIKPQSWVDGGFICRSTFLESGWFCSHDLQDEEDAIEKFINLLLFEQWEVIEREIPK
jgi:hypothetical protein